MFINDKGKIFGKISIIDLIVILGILVAAFGIYTKFSAPATEKIATETKAIEYKVLVRGVRQGTVDALKNSKRVTNTSTKEHCGDIINVSAAPAIHPAELTDGTVQNVEFPEQFDVTLTIALNGKVSESGYYTESNQSVNIGSTLYMNTKYANTSGTIIDIYTVE